MLVPEAEAEPGVDQLGIRRRNHRVVGRPTLRDPGRGGRAVEVADELRRRGRVAGRLDPHVRSPDLVERHADEVAGDVAGAEGDDAGRAVAGQKRGDLGAGGVRLLVARVERGLGTTPGRVPGGEQNCSVVEVLLGEGCEGRGAGHGEAGHRPS